MLFSRLCMPDKKSQLGLHGFERAVQCQQRGKKTQPRISLSLQNFTGIAPSRRRNRRNSQRPPEAKEEKKDILVVGGDCSSSSTQDRSRKRGRHMCGRSEVSEAGEKGKKGRRGGEEEEEESTVRPPSKLGRKREERGGRGGSFLVRPSCPVGEGRRRNHKSLLRRHRRLRRRRHHRRGGQGRKEGRGEGVSAILGGEVGEGNEEEK